MGKASLKEIISFCELAHLRKEESKAIKIPVMMKQ